MQTRPQELTYSQNTHCGPAYTFLDVFAQIQIGVIAQIHKYTNTKMVQAGPQCVFLKYVSSCGRVCVGSLPW